MSTSVLPLQPSAVVLLLHGRAAQGSFLFHTKRMPVRRRGQCHSGRNFPRAEDAFKPLLPESHKKILTFPQRIDEDQRMKRQKALSVGVNLSVGAARRAQVFSLSENLRSI
jgi:hypothetical protein